MSLKEFNLYKGLQKPLVFKAFKGKFIYWGVGAILGGLLSCMILSALLGILPGILSLILILGAGLGFTAYKQKDGLHEKTNSVGVYILPNQYKRGKK